MDFVTQIWTIWRNYLTLEIAVMTPWPKWTNVTSPTFIATMQPLEMESVTIIIMDHYVTMIWETAVSVLGNWSVTNVADVVVIAQLILIFGVITWQVEIQIIEDLIFKYYFVFKPTKISHEIDFSLKIGWILQGVPPSCGYSVLRSGHAT